MQGDTKGYAIGDQFGTYFLTFTVVDWVDLINFGSSEWHIPR